VVEQGIFPGKQGDIIRQEGKYCLHAWFSLMWKAVEHAKPEDPPAPSKLAQARA
jgi:hypothetical protein